MVVITVVIPAFTLVMALVVTALVSAALDSAWAFLTATAPPTGGQRPDEQWYHQQRAQQAQDAGALALK